MLSDLSCRVMHPGALSEAQMDAWQRLCAGHPIFQSPFLTPAFARAVAAVHSRVRVAVLEKHGAPVGFLPFQFASRWQQWLKVAEPAGGHMSDYFGLIAKSGIQLSGRQLASLARLSYLGFTHLDETQLQFGLEGEQPEPGLRIHFPEGGPAYWEQLRNLDKKFVEDTQRRQRQLIVQYGQLRFEAQVTDWREPLAYLIDRKREQYARTKAADGFAEPWKRQLLFALAECQHPLCSGILSTLHAGDTWVASHFGLRCGDLLHYWFPVYNPELHRYAPGRVLLKQILESSAKTGLRCIDRGAGDSPAKRDFANQEHTYYRGAWLRLGLRSSLYRSVCAVQWRLGRAVL